MGVGFYTGVALCNKHTFKEADLMSILRGICLGVLIWPVGILIKAYDV